MAEPVSGGSGIPGALYGNSGTLTQPATLQESYYGNGWNAQLQAITPGAAYTQQASYRSDGVDKDDYYSAIGGSITRAYTAAGRETGRTDLRIWGSCSPLNMASLELVSEYWYFSYCVHCGRWEPNF